jgi:nucleoside-diphosphate-sugar epimerase
LFNVFGIRQDPRGAYAAAISAFVDAALAGRAPKIFGDGLATRDFVPVSEVVNAMLLSARAAEMVRGESFNVGLGDSTQIREICSMIYGLVGCSQLPEFLPVREGDVPFSCASIEKARRLLGFSPRTSVLDGLKQLVADEATRGS